jgi:hypothetical protein
VAVTDDHCPILVIPLIGISGQEFGYLRFQRVRDSFRAPARITAVSASLAPRSSCSVLVLLRIVASLLCG